MAYTSYPDRLKKTVEILQNYQDKIKAYYENITFKPYKIDIKNCLKKQEIEDTVRLLDLSFTTRQGGQNKTALAEYPNSQKRMKIKSIFNNLYNTNKNPKEKYYSSLRILMGINGIGQKIATMFLKFLVRYGDDSKHKKELEKELFIPLDIHVLRLMFTEIDKKRPNRLSLYKNKINQASLGYSFPKTKAIGDTKLFKIQKMIQDDFKELGIDESPIILDELWYIGTIYCRYKELEIGCKICPLEKICNKGK